MRVAARVGAQPHGRLPVLQTPAGERPGPVAGPQAQRREHRPGEDRLQLRQPGDDTRDGAGPGVGQAVRPAAAGEQGARGVGERQVQVRAVARAAGERDRRERHAEPVPGRRPSEQDAGQHRPVRGEQRVRGRERDLELVGAVLGVQLFDRHIGGREARLHVGQEPPDVQHGAHPVALPGTARPRRPVGGDEHELQLRAHRRAQAGRPGSCGDRPQPRPRAPAVRRPALLVQVRGCPGDAVVDDGQHVRVDPQAQVADHAEGRGERDAEVDAEHVPRRGGAHPDVDEHRQPVTRHGLGAGHARRVDDGAEHQPDPAVRERGVDRAEIGPPVGHGD